MNSGLKKVFAAVLLLMLSAACSNFPLLKTSETPEAQTVIVFHEPEEIDSCPTQIVCPACETCQEVQVCPTCPENAAAEASFVSEETLEAEQVVMVTATPTDIVQAAATEMPAENRVFEISGNPAYMQNFVHPEAACGWMGVAGQVIDKYGMPVYEIVVLVEGSLLEEDVELIGLSSSAMAYGPGGYEIKLADLAVNSSQTLKISLYDMSGNRLYGPVIFDTYQDCTKNLYLINFRVQ